MAFLSVFGQLPQGWGIFKAAPASTSWGTCWLGTVTAVATRWVGGGLPCTAWPPGEQAWERGTPCPLPVLYSLFPAEPTRGAALKLNPAPDGGKQQEGRVWGRARKGMYLSMKVKEWDSYSLWRFKESLQGFQVEYDPKGRFSHTPVLPLDQPLLIGFVKADWQEHRHSEL